MAGLNFLIFRFIPRQAIRHLHFIIAKKIRVAHSDFFRDFFKATAGVCPPLRRFGFNRADINLSLFDFLVNKNLRKSAEGLRWITKMVKRCAKT